MGKLKFCVLLFCIAHLATVAKAQEVDQNLLIDSISAYKPISKTGIQFRLLPIVNKFKYVGDHPDD